MLTMLQMRLELVRSCYVMCGIVLTATQEVFAQGAEFGSHSMRLVCAKCKRTTMKLARRCKNLKMANASAIRQRMLAASCSKRMSSCALQATPTLISPMQAMWISAVC